MNNRVYIALFAVLLVYFISISMVIAQPGYTVFDFEDGTLQGWKVLSGNSIKLPTAPDSALRNCNQQGKYFIGLDKNPDQDKAAIVLQSPPFRVKADNISLLVGGSYDPENCYVALYRVSDDKEIIRETGFGMNLMTRRYWDVHQYKRQRVYLKIVYSNTEKKNRLNVDDIREMSPADERARVQELVASQKRYEKWLKSVKAPASKIVYSGNSDAAMPLGGIGSGHISICADGVIKQWNIFNNTNNSCEVPCSFFAIWAKPANGKPAVRLLQQTPIAGMNPVSRVELIGEYPVAELHYKDDNIPVQVGMQAFSPYIPLNEKDSSIPAVIFEVSIENKGTQPVDISLLATLQNAVGFDGLSEISDVWNKSYGGNTNAQIGNSDMHGLFMSNPALKSDDEQFGTMCLTALAQNVQLTAQWSDMESLWRSFSANGDVRSINEIGPSKEGQTWNGALTVPASLQPGQKIIIPIVWSWHFPIYYSSGSRLGRMYSNRFADAEKVAEYITANYSRLSGDTEKFKRTFYRTSLPYWMLNRISVQSSTLSNSHMIWQENGYLALMGNQDNYPDAWNYEQQISYMFPDLERSILQFDLKNAPGNDEHHLGTILKAYRSYRQSSDRNWLDANWSQLKSIIAYTLGSYNPDKTNAFYSAALKAGEVMAEIEGDTAFVSDIQAVYESSRSRLESAWNGEFYGRNCSSDQLLGQWWANTLDLGYLLPRERVNSSLNSIMKYNWVKDFREAVQVPRQLAGNGDAGLLNWTYSKMPYNSEAWTGVEYEVAALMLYEGRVNEAYQIVKACSDRFNGMSRSPMNRNPWSESGYPDQNICALSAWGMLLAAEGYKYNGPDMTLEFNPNVSAQSFSGFFTDAAGWGLFSQKREDNTQADVVNIEFGNLKLKKLILHLPDSALDACKKGSVMISVNKTPGSFTRVIDGTMAKIEFSQPITVSSGEELRVTFSWE